MDIKRKYIILLTLVILLSVVFFYTAHTLVKDEAKKIKTIDRKIKTAQEKLNSAEVLSEELSAVSTVIKNSITNDKSFATEEINDFSKRLADLADKYRISVYSVLPKQVYSTGHSIEHKYTLEIDCNYVQMGQFLTELESFDNIIKVNSIDVRPIGDDAQVEQNEDGTVAAIETRYMVTIDISTFKVRKEA